jgi:flagellar hook-basal body complex protein FliE
MDVSSISSVSGLKNLYKIKQSSPTSIDESTLGVNSDNKTFKDVLDGVMNIVDETNSLQIKAQNEEVKFALGESDNTHDLMIAQKKALVALQYTVAVRDRFIQGYQEIMNMQI